MTAPVSSEMVQVEGFKRTRGRPNCLGVRKGLVACDLKADMVLDRVEWWNRICDPDPNYWDKVLLL